ncbi:MAG: hypothetical protein QOI41_6193, partial [Myxococcales bacterium]|nr:hypothetical protein [Myxococcales bacterium]
MKPPPVVDIWERVRIALSEN